MSELEMKTEAEAYEFKFTDELSDEALDRAEGATDVVLSVGGSGGCFQSS